MNYNRLPMTTLFLVAASALAAEAQSTYKGWNAVEPVQDHRRRAAGATARRSVRIDGSVFSGSYPTASPAAPSPARTGRVVGLINVS